MERTESGHVETHFPPLILSEIGICGFRCISAVANVPIQPELTILTGENDGGKTTCLDAIAFLLGAYSADGEDYSHPQAENPTIGVEGLFFEVGDVVHGSPIHIRARQPRMGSRTVEILDRVHRSLKAPLDKMLVADLRSQLQSIGVSMPGSATKPQLLAALQEWLANQPPEDFEDCWRPITRSELARLPKLTRFASAAVPDPVGTIREVVTQMARRELTGTAYQDRLEVIAKEIEGDIAPHLQRIKDKICEHCQEIESVEVRATFDFAKVAPQVDVVLGRDGGKEFNLKIMGQGRVRRVTLAVHEANLQTMEEETSHATQILLYDEPDTHLDYAAQRQLFSILKRQAGLPHAQVVVATHSKNFIDMAPMPAILRFRLDEDQQSRVEGLVGEGHEAELAFQATICESLGLRNSMLLDERCFIVVEGETEEAAVPLLFPAVVGKTLVAVGIHRLNTRGHGSMRTFVTALKTQLKRDVVLLADTEAASKVEKRRRSAWLGDLELSVGMGAYYVGAREFEDAFSDEVWVRALTKEFPPVNGEPAWTLADLEAFRKEPKFSEALHSTVCRRCKDSGISKPDLGRALAGACRGLADIPAVLQECFLFAHRLTGRA